LGDFGTNFAPTGFYERYDLEIPEMAEGRGVRYIEAGPFHRFLGEVIGRPQERLERHRLPLVTVETIERIATEQFALSG
jgi:hypothetical protein